MIFLKQLQVQSMAEALKELHPTVSGDTVENVENVFASVRYVESFR